MQPTLRIMGPLRRCLPPLLRNARGDRRELHPHRLLSSFSDSSFSDFDSTGDRNVDIFDRALKSKQVAPMAFEFHLGFKVGIAQKLIEAICAERQGGMAHE